MHDSFGRPHVVVPRRALLIGDGLTVLGLVALGIVRAAPPKVIGYFAIGGGIGVATCIPIGIANVMVIDAAHRHGGVRALGTSIGGALADGIYSSLGIFGIGPLLARHPSVPSVLRGITGVVLVVYGILLVRSRPPTIEPGAGAITGRGHLARGIGVGLAATLLNPSAALTWVVIVGSHAVGVSTAEGAAWVLGIVLGTFAWFLVVMSLALHGRRVLRGNAGWMTRVVGVLVIASGIFSLGRI
jgi:arginine exporter protein ArgO